MTKVLGLLSALGSIAAGVYLLDTQAVQENSLLETMMHGIGIYFLAKGLYLGATVYVQEDIRMLLRRSEKDAHSRKAAETP